MNNNNELEKLRERATQFFKLTCIDDNVVGLPENEYLTLTNCRFCGRKLHRRRHLFTDGDEGIIASGKRCSCCGTIYTTHRVMYVLTIACSPEKLILLYSRPVTYQSFRPLKGYNEFVKRDDVIFIEGDHYHNVFPDTFTEPKQQKTNVLINEENRKKNPVKHSDEKKQRANKKCKNNHSVIRINSVVVIDDMAEYRSEDYDIQIMSKVTGKIYTMNIQADYKNESGHYFISKETYEKLSERGIPLCRLIKKKDYTNRMKENDIDLKPQSVLMDYGYNVAEQNHLSKLARHNILALLIDTGICSKTRIISYLKFFIKQRSSNQTMTDAIAKWEDDISFVEGYVKGTLQKTWPEDLDII